MRTVNLNTVSRLHLTTSSKHNRLWSGPVHRKLTAASCLLLHSYLERHPSQSVGYVSAETSVKHVFRRRNPSASR